MTWFSHDLCFRNYSIASQFIIIRGNGYYYFSGDNLTKSTNQINGRKANHNQDNVQYINFGEDDQMVSYFQTMLPYYGNFP